jgi:UTP--glucose-1-phosphate uridylyltransferase
MEDFFPLDTGGDDDWCPAGHGDFYMSFSGSGLLSELMDLGYRYVFISNIDNLCAEISPLILGLMKDKGIDFLMEVTRKTKADVKGGAPVFYKDRLTLLEIAQVPDEKMNDFQDIDKFSYFNTNNLWIDMKAMKKAIAERKLNLPVIKNQKKIANTDIIQVETAMGAALQSFERAGIVDVERVRFSPVKKMTDLLMLQSDIFLMDKDFRIIRNPDRPDALSILPSIKFHSGFMKENELSRHFEDPSTFSLINVESITIGGDVFFEKNVQVEGNVEISSTGSERLVVKDGTVLRGAL